MRKTTIFLLFFVVCVLSLQAGEVRINPTPQSIKWGGKQIPIHEIRILGSEQADSQTLKELKALFPTTGDKKAYPVYIGKKGDKAIKKYVSEIPQVPGAYYLNIDDEGIVMAGYDEKGTFYALQTLKQILKNGTLVSAEIKDYPDVLYRGTVEGFYGQPWSHRDRISQLNFYGANKMNTYIYGPKDDPYHSCPNWRKPYPTKEGAQISELVEVAKANKVDFVWAIHPGQDIKWNEEDRNLLLQKFEWMYQLGVRSFAVFFDDISGEGTDPNRQAELLNFLHDRFVKVKKDVAPLVMCPTQYNKSWSDPKPGTYLDILGDKLNPSIQIMWTGDRVISDITTEGLQWINKRLKRNAYIWWNFPVNDYVRDHLLLGRSYGLDSTAGKLMSGFVSNPMDKAEASKVAIYSVADYAWNVSAYNSNQSWKAAIQDVMPETTEAFQTFASHNSDLGKNGHGYRREESTLIKPTADRVTTALAANTPPSDTDLKLLDAEFLKVKQAPEILLAANENPALLNEIHPWLMQFETLGKAGQAALHLYKSLNNSPNEMVNNWNQYCYLEELVSQKEKIAKSNNQNPYQPGIKTGSLVLQPFVETLTLWNSKQLYKQLNQGQAQTNNNNIQTQARLLTDIDQLKLVQLQTNDQNIAITPLLEVVKINAGQYFSIELPLVINTGTLDLNLNNKELKEWGKIETSEDGKNWNNLEFDVKGTNVVAQMNTPLKIVRLTNVGNTPKEFHLRKFILQSAQLSGQGGNSLTAIDGDLATSFTFTGIQKFDKTISGNPNQVTILTTPNAETNLIIFAIDGQNRKQKIGRIMDAYATWDVPQNTVALEINSISPCNLHEIIWK